MSRGGVFASFRRLFPPIHWVERAAVVCLVLALVKCSAPIHQANVPDSLPALGGDLDRADAHTQSAEQINKLVKPLAGPIVQPLLTQESKEHQATGDALHSAQKSLTHANAERSTLADENEKQAQTIIKITNSWGYQFELLVERLFWLIVGLTGLHFLLGFGGLMVSGPEGAIMARIGVYLNPAAWFQSARDNYYFRTAPSAAAPVAVAVGGGGGSVAV